MAEALDEVFGDGGGVGGFFGGGVRADGDDLHGEGGEDAEDEDDDGDHRQDDRRGQRPAHRQRGAIVPTIGQPFVG